MYCCVLVHDGIQKAVPLVRVLGWPWHPVLSRPWNWSAHICVVPG